MLTSAQECADATRSHWQIHALPARHVTGGLLDLPHVNRRHVPQICRRITRGAIVQD
jgi:hypothetical protein